MTRPLLAVLFLAAGCQPAETPPPSALAPLTEASASADAPSQSPLTETLWLSTDDDDAPGTLRAFLSDGSLLVTSCVETYRIAQWRTDPDGALVWMEDTAELLALVDEATDTTLRLRVIAGPDTLARTYRAADGPTACPDLR